MGLGPKMVLMETATGSTLGPGTAPDVPKAESTQHTCVDCAASPALLAGWSLPHEETPDAAAEGHTAQLIQEGMHRFFS